jgi:hypothetical protein
MRTAQRITGLPIGGRALALVTMAVALMIPAFSSSALASSSPPQVQIESAEQTHTGFRLKAKMNPEGSATTYYFIYKKVGEVECEDLEGCGPSTPHGGPLTGDTQQEVQAEVTGLTPGTTYIYWLIARNASPEAVRSGELTFTTPPAGAPPSEVVTGPAEPTPSGYKLKGRLNPDGLPTTYYYEYIGSNEVECLDMEPGLERCWHETAHAGPITGDTQQEVPPVEVTGLTAGVTYHYRLVASNADRTVFGNEASFTVGSPPSIISESVSHVTPTDAALEAQIDTEGLPALYQFQLSSICGGRGACLYVINYPLPSGLLLGSFIDQSVSLDLNSAGVTLEPGGTYSYSVSATSSAGTTKSPAQTLTTPEEGIEPLSTTTSTPSGSSQPVGPSVSGQPRGSGGSSSSSSSSPLPSIGVLGTHVAKTTELKPPTNAQKLANALKACAKKPKDKRATCEEQARKQYGAVAKKSKR